MPASVAAQIVSGQGRPDFIGELDGAQCIDSAFEFEGFNALPLGFALAHPALFAAYPSLANITVQVDPTLYLGASLGQDDEGTTILTIGGGQQVSALLHEIQHAIQFVESFAEGGTLKSLGFERFDTVLTTTEIAAVDHYHHLTGEVEARNTQARPALTYAQRQRTSPLATQDVSSEAVVLTQRTVPTPSTATPESVQAAITALLGSRTHDELSSSAQILVTTSTDMAANGAAKETATPAFSRSIMNNLRLQNRQLTHKAATSLIEAVVSTTAQAFYDSRSNTITMVADRIPVGQEKAVLLHELTHKFGRTELGEPAWRTLVDQVKGWRSAALGSNERAVYNQALCRTASVKGLVQQVEVYDEKLFAYAVESAITMSIQPSVHALPHSTERWLAAVVAMSPHRCRKSKSTTRATKSCCSCTTGCATSVRPTLPVRQKASSIGGH